MQLPNISFSETNVGITPINSVAKNRIGIIGEFSRGPANTASYIAGFSDFSYRYGSDTKSGSLAYQAAYDQGATDFALLRVLGNAQSAKGTVVFTGTATKSNTLIAQFNFIGQAYNIASIPLDTLVLSSGIYTGTLTGRYFFKVSALTSSTATIQYQFILLGSEPLNADKTINYGAIVWTGVTTTLTVNLASDMGVIKPVANGLNITFGTIAQTNPIALQVGNIFSVRCNATTLTVPINPGDIPNQIATNFIDNLAGVAPLGLIERTVADNGVIFTLSPDLVGEIGNRYTFFLTLQDNTAPGITFTSSGSANTTYMTGGEDGPRNAVRDFFTLNGVPLLRLIATSQGEWGNQLRINLYPLSNNEFNLTITDLNASNFNPALNPESYTLDFTNLDGNGQLLQLLGSNYVRGFFLPQVFTPNAYDASLLLQSPQRLSAPDTNITDTTDPRYVNNYGPTYLTNVSLINGYDGPELTDTDYIAALSTLSNTPINILVCAGIYNRPNIQQTMIEHCQNASDADGLRIAILNAPPALVPNTAKASTLGYDSTRAVMVAGWSTYAGQPNYVRFGLAPDAVYAGKLAAIPFYVGPNARTSAGPVFSITEVDTRQYNSSANLQLYTNAKLEILTVDNYTQAYTFTNASTLSSDANWQKIYLRRTYDYIRQDIFNLLQSYKSEPNTTALRTALASGINAYMGELLNKSFIANFNNAICDGSNNSSADYINGILNVSFTFLPLYSVDEINVTIIRDSASGLVSFTN